MQESIVSEQIICACEGDNDVIIFDRDHWDDEKKNRGTEKEIEGERKQKIDQGIISKIDCEIKNTKENFFKVNVVKSGSKVINGQKLEKIKNPNSILKEGFMEKKTDGFFFSWHKRYMVLTSEKLFSFEDQMKAKTIACVNLKLLPAQLEENQNGLLLDFKNQCQNLLLRSFSKEDQKQWKIALTKVLQYHSHTDKILLKTMNKPFYDSKDSLSQQQFVSQAQTGDILLFHTRNTGAKIQRVLTNSEYDHVAMVVKLNQKNLMVFQSNQNHGVSLYEWKTYINYFDLYEKVTLRKLNYVRKKDAQTTILSFVKKNIGKFYDISINKLLKLQSDFNWEEVKEDRGYFCSELVAKVLKSIGLLDEKKSSGRYWPVDFSQKNEFILKKGASLGPEQSIILNKHIRQMI